MRTSRLLKLTAWIAALILVTACASSGGIGRHSKRIKSGQYASTKTVKSDKKQKKKQKKESLADTTNDTIVEPVTLDKEEFLQQVNDNAQLVRFLTSKVKFTLETGSRQMTLTGNLKMKRDDVIRLQLMAFGFVEAGRLEFTKEYVLIVDRINKQYIKVPYEQLDFLRNSSIDFFTLQALFWNEISQPLRKLKAENSIENDVVLSVESGKLAYSWLAESKNGRIKMANILYRDNYRGNYQLNWDYEEFKANERKFFPTKQIVTFTTPDTKVKFELKLNNIGKDEEWETRTTLSGKYRQMPVEDILRRFMSL